MKVVLSTSPHVRHAAVLQSDFAPDNTVMYSFAPLGLLSLAAVLRQTRADIACEIYDLNRRILAGAIPLNARFYEALAEDICSRSPDVIGFMTECDSYHHVLQIAEVVKKIEPGCCVVLGGPHASAVARATLERCDAVDAVVIGEGEASFRELMEAIGTDRPVPGTLLRASTGEIIEGGSRALIDRLDSLPVPAYDMYQPDPSEEVFIEVGRGCPFQCEFCSTAPYWQRRHRVKSPERVLSEVLLVRHLFDTKRVHFTHDLFTTNREWVRNVCNTLIQANVPIRWTCSARTDTVDEELLALMSRAGCAAIYFGIESGSQRILREIRKEIPISRSFQILQACHQQGITPNAGFIVGFPSEDNTSLRETLLAYEHTLRLGCRPTHLFAYCPFAGSTMYPKLGGLHCTGHFVDLPLGRETDVHNRKRIASDADLYGAYFRPDLPDLVPGEPRALVAIDEFSSLVEAALVPALALSQLRGGMYEVFCCWLRWVQAFNNGRQAAAYRRAYGTAAAFASFVLEELSSSAETPLAALAIARAVHTNLTVAENTTPEASTTMASHRSLVLPLLEDDAELALDTRLARGSVVATLALEYDVTAALAGRLDGDPPKEPTYLAWQIMSDRSVRLLRIDRSIFDTLETLRTRSKTVGELVLKRFGGKAGGEAPAEAVDPSEMLASLATAAREGLVTVGSP